MIKASLIYLVITILLALIDAIRIKVRWGKVGDIDHLISDFAAVGAGIPAMVWWVVAEGKTFVSEWLFVLATLLICLSFMAIRLCFYDPFLNLFRILFKVNPTMRLDYVSVKTTSYEDQHSNKLSFWKKRVFALGAWITCLGVYYLIFKSW